MQNNKQQKEEFNTDAHKTTICHWHIATNFKQLMILKANMAVRQ